MKRRKIVENNKKTENTSDTSFLDMRQRDAKFGCNDIANKYLKFTQNDSLALILDTLTEQKDKAVYNFFNDHLSENDQTIHITHKLKQLKIGQKDGQKDYMYL